MKKKVTKSFLFRYVAEKVFVMFMNKCAIVGNTLKTREKFWRDNQIITA